MRWELLFDDLESQLDQEQREEERALALEEERLRLGRLTLRDRLTAMATAGGTMPPGCSRVELRGGEVQTAPARVRSRLDERWARRAATRPRQCIVPLGASRQCCPAGPKSMQPRPMPGSAARLAERIGLPFVLRDLCRSRRRCNSHGRRLAPRHDRPGRPRPPRPRRARGGNAATGAGGARHTGSSRSTGSCSSTFG